MLKTKKAKLFFFLLLLFFLLGANFVFVSRVSALEINYPRLPGLVPPQDFLESIPSEDIPSLFARYILNLAIWAGGLIALGSLIYGGIRYLTSTGKPETMASAKDQISSAFFGLLILLSSFLILKTISPQFLVLKIPKPEPIKVVEKPEIPPPPTEELRTSINTEIPFGTIIEKGIFDGTKPWQKGKRIPRIKNNAETTKEIADRLKKQSEDLKEYSDQCECKNTHPDPYCGSGGEEIHRRRGCGNCPPEHCTSDPCAPVRTKIQSAEDKNQREINNLIAEQKKTEEEVRLLKEQLNRLERAEKFMLECYDWIDSLADFLIKKTDFAEKKWPFRKINFWEEILIKGDWATFYCPVSGTIMGEVEYTASTISPETMKELEEAAVVTEIPEPAEPTACTTGISVGEVIDRTKRVTQLLIDKMGILIGKDKELIDAVDKLQVLISQCTSKRCEPRCWCRKSDDRRYCYGYRGCCAPSSPSRSCKNSDTNSPCPYPEIENQLKEVQRIWQEITDLVRGKGDNNTPETIGIIPILAEIIPKILEDLEIIIRAGMQSCISEIPSDVSDSEEVFKNLMLLSNCGSAIRGVGPDGIIIQNCCLEQDEFQECLSLCYLERGDKEYKNCLQKCLEEKASELEMGGFPKEAEILKTCRHKLNFYCCGG